MKSIPFIQSFPVLAIGLSLLFSIACQKSEKNDQPPGSENSTATVKLTRGGQVVAEFTMNADAQTAKSMLDGKQYTLFIFDTAKQHSLMLDVVGDTPGTYAFSEAQNQRNALFNFDSYVLPSFYEDAPGHLVVETGEITVTKATDSRCVGRFTGTGINGKDKNTYTLEGEFDLLVQKL